MWCESLVRWRQNVSPGSGWGREDGSGLQRCATGKTCWCCRGNEMPVVRAVSDLRHGQGSFWIFRCVVWGHVAKTDGFFPEVGCWGTFSLGLGGCGNSFFLGGGIESL